MVSFGQQLNKMQITFTFLELLTHTRLGGVRGLTGFSAGNTGISGKRWSMMEIFMMEQILDTFL